MHLINDADFVSQLQPALQSQDWDLLVQTIRKNWTPDQILHLLHNGSCDARKIAALAIGLVGKPCALDALAHLLRDPDKMIVQMAEHAMWQIWFRGGNEESNRLVARGAEALNMQDVDRALGHLNKAIEIDPDFAEAYNQRAIAYYLSERNQESIADCRRAIELMPLHFGAMAGMGHCHVALGELAEALNIYEQALKINPHLDCIAEMVQELKEQSSK